LSFLFQRTKETLAEEFLLIAQPSTLAASQLRRDGNVAARKGNYAKTGAGSATKSNFTLQVFINYTPS